MSFGTHTQDEFNRALQSHLEGCIAIHDKAYPKPVHKERWDFDWLKKRVRITRGGSVHSFIDMETGDVLMAASFKAPAKHARGNIYDEHNGLKNMGPFGPRTLR